MENKKKEYHKPILKDYGSVREITRAQGMTHITDSIQEGSMEAREDWTN